MDIYQDSKCLALEKALEDKSVEPIDLPFLFLKAITKNFSDNEQIGRGGFGAVYRGALRNGVVAVKKLYDYIEILEENFRREVGCLAEVKHKNIVRFLGYCSETQQLRTLYEGNYVWANVMQRLFCFEYLSKGSLANYLTEASSGLQWRERYQIIKGICEGVGYLHKQRIIHLDLKPQNILLDDGMVPKIADFGISRRFGENQSRTITENKVGSWGYMAPEFLRSGRITLKTDIYSLGVIIMEILMGRRKYSNVDKVLESWANTLGTSESCPLLEQVKVCAEIGINCKDDEPGNRPAIQDIIRMLDKTDVSNSSVGSVASTSSAGQLVDEVKPMAVSSKIERSVMSRFGQHYLPAQKTCKPMRISASKMPGETTTELDPGRSESELLDVHPLELCFPFEAGKRIECSLNVVNRTDRHVVYFLIPQFPDLYTRIDKPCHVMCEMCSGTLNVTMVEQEQQPRDAGMLVVLMMAIESHRNYQLLIKCIKNDPTTGDPLKRVEEFGGEMHAAVLRAVVCPPREIVSAPKIVPRVKFTNMKAIDVHPAEPWVLVGHDKYLSIWDYEKQAAIVESLEVQGEAAGPLYSNTAEETKVYSVRFIPRREWFVAGDSWGYIHVYACLIMNGEVDEIKRFKAANGGSPVVSLAIHPARPYLLSACCDGVIQLWDWDLSWVCFRKVHHFSDNTTGGQVLVKFNPKDARTFTSCDKLGGLKVWPIHHSSVEPITTVEKNSSHLYDHVFTETGQDHVVIIASNGLNIWDLKTGTRIHTFRETPCFNTAVSCHPTLPLIAAGTMANDFYGPSVVRFWNSTNYRLEKTVSCASDSWINNIGFVGSKRLVIQTEEEIEVLEIDMESLSC